MARQPITIGAANAKGGDNLNVSFTKINANETELYVDVADTVTKTLANTNGLAAEVLRTTANLNAIAAQALLVTANANAIVANTNAISGFTTTYWFDANDTATVSSPIAHVGGATNTYLTNNAVGPSTSSYNPSSKDVLWKPASNTFDFSSLKIGDVVEIRIDLTITNAAAQEIDLKMSLAEGSGGPFELSIVHLYYKTAATGTPITALFRFYIGSDTIKNNPARIRFKSLAAASIRVNGWFYQITEV